MFLYEKIRLEKEEQEKFNNMIDVTNRSMLPEDTKYISMMTSSSHTYGNALAFIQKWLMERFPTNMFRSIHVNSKIAYRQLRSTPHEYVKRVRPLIVFKPRVADRDDDKFLKNTSFIERQTDLYSTWGLTNLQPFFDDPENNFSIKFQMNRVVMNVDILLSFDTLMQQLDFYNYVDNAFRINHPMFLETHLESLIPQEMLEVISKAVNIPVFDSNNRTYDFLKYVNGKSKYPITYKLQGSTQNLEFFRYYPVNIETTIMDLNKDDGDRNGLTNNNYNITFTIKMEFNTTGFYYLFANNIYDIKLPEFDPDSSDLIPIYTDVILREDLHLKEGWSLFNRGTCKIEEPNEELDFEQMLNSSINAAFDYHKENGLMYSEFIDIKIRRQGHLIQEGIDYTIDYDNKKIKFINQNTYYTFTIMICLNVGYINDLVKAIFKLK